MALTETKQIQEILKKSKHVLITFKKDYSIDAVASGLALYLVLKKMNKLVDIACDGFVLPKNLKFLPKSSKIQSKINNLQKFIISVDLEQDKIDTFSYNIEDKKLKIYLTPKSGTFSPDDIKTEDSNYKYDLIVTLDTQDLESLNGFYQKFTDFFYETAILNIDHQSDNEEFGQINVTNFNAVAVAEILFNVLKNLGNEFMDTEIATCLLAGLITKTKSFKTSNVTPATLKIAGELLNIGADREMIVKNLYRSRTVATMNLWGRVLARLRHGTDTRLIWSILTENDFVEARAEETDLPDVVDELISFIPGVEVVALIYRFKGEVKILVQALNKNNALKLTSEFKPVGSSQVARFSLADTTLAEAEQKVTEVIKAKLGQT